jgi:hypothetical protein
MKSPITGMKMKAVNELREKDDIKYLYQYFLCEDSGEKFTTTELDDENLDRYKNAKINSTRKPTKGISEDLFKESCIRAAKKFKS